MKNSWSHYSRMLRNAKIIFHSQACKLSYLRNGDLCSTSMFTSPPWQTIALCKKLKIYYKLRMFDLVVQVRYSAIGGATRILFKSIGMQLSGADWWELLRGLDRVLGTWLGLAWLCLTLTAHSSAVVQWHLTYYWYPIPQAPWYRSRKWVSAAVFAIERMPC